MELINRITLDPNDPANSIARVDTWMNRLADILNMGDGKASELKEEISAIRSELNDLKVPGLRTCKQISSQTLRSTQASLAAKTWTNVNTITPDTITLRPGYYLIEQNVELYGSATGFVMVRPYDLKSNAEITGHRSSGSVITSTYSACNNTFTMHVTTDTEYQLTFQAYGSAAHSINTCKQTITKLA